MNKQQTKFKFGTADSVLLAVGTLALDFVSTSQREIVEIPPGGKKLCLTLEEYEAKIVRYGIKIGPHYPGSSIGNFLNQAQLLSFMNPTYASMHLSTVLATHDPTTEILLKSLTDKKITYSITDFTEADAKNPTALLVESRSYTKIVSFKDKRTPPIEVRAPKTGTAGVVVIGAAAGDTVATKTNTLNYAKKHKLPLVMVTTEGEITALTKNKPLRAITDEILAYASLISCNEDEVRRILLAINANIKLPQDKVALAKLFRETVKNEHLDILLSYGAGGSLFLTGDKAYIQSVPYFPQDKIVSTAGAGDTLAGAFVEGVRIKGLDDAGIQWVLPRANRAAQNVLKYADTRSGQFTAEQFQKQPPSDFRLEVVKV